MNQVTINIFSQLRLFALWLGWSAGLIIVQYFKYDVVDWSYVIGISGRDVFVIASVWFVLRNK